ncbi:hypothetical protein [Roseovarius sp. EL26]|uniref:hypothetical protein n=1 Tax=Roseovarius sp. EL26 TaxID=2126672 RepID=UPI000EA1362F|nr:hypothetical protein [Roseovarius sp. EL26]
MSDLDLVEVAALQNRIVDLEKAGKRAGAITALVGLVAAIIGGVIGAFGLYVRFNDELRNWDAIKEVHARQVSGREVFDHAALSPAEIAIIVEQLNIPDFSQLVTKEDLPDELDTTIFLKTSDFPAVTELALKTDLVGFAKSSEIPSLDGYAKISELPRQPNLSNYVKFGDSIMISYGNANMFPNDGYVLYDSRRVSWKLQRP